MNRLFSAILVGIITLFAFTRAAEAGTCRISITVDHSGSMATPRADHSLKPNGDPQTRCFAASTAVLQLLSAYGGANVFDITQLPGAVVVSSNDVYDTTCPNDADRLVSIRVFRQLDFPLGSFFDLVTKNGFEPWEQAFTDWQKSIYYDVNTHSPTETCVGGTPLAAAMCTSAADFPQGLPAAGELRQGYIFTDGGENASDLASCRVASDPVDPGAPGSGGWGDRVTAAFTSRGIEGHGFLFMEGAQTLLARNASIARLEPEQAQLLLRPQSATAPPATTDQMFLSSFATQTRGSFTALPDTMQIAPSVALVDTDGDGVPDFRDFCPFGMCKDTDGDQIPDSVDACLVDEFEDGNGPFPADGCSDFDSDGIIDGKDLCPTLLEDWYPPKPNDGCPRVGVAAPATPGVMLGLLGAGMLGLGIMHVRRSRRLIEDG